MDNSPNPFHGRPPQYPQHDRTRTPQSREEEFEDAPRRADFFYRARDDGLFWAEQTGVVQLPQVARRHRREQTPTRSKGEFLQNHVKSTTIPLSEGNTCEICWDPYDKDKHAPVQIDVSGCPGHVFGRSCLLSWVETDHEGHGKTNHKTCPKCRASLFKIQRVISPEDYRRLQAEEIARAQRLLEEIDNRRRQVMTTNTHGHPDENLEELMLERSEALDWARDALTGRFDAQRAAIDGNHETIGQRQREALEERRQLHQYRRRAFEHRYLNGQQQQALDRQYYGGVIQPREQPGHVSVSPETGFLNCRRVETETIGYPTGYDFLGIGSSAQVRVAPAHYSPVNENTGGGYSRREPYTHDVGGHPTGDQSELHVMGDQAQFLDATWNGLTGQVTARPNDSSRGSQFQSQMPHSSTRHQFQIPADPVAASAFQNWPPATGLGRHRQQHEAQFQPTGQPGYRQDSSGHSSAVSPNHVQRSESGEDSYSMYASLFNRRLPHHHPSN